MTTVKMKIFSARSLMMVSLLLSLVFAFAALLGVNTTKATSLDPDLNINVGSAVSLSLTNCDNSNSTTIKLAVDPTPNGTFKSACQTTSVGTNTPGYSLTVRSSSSDLNYLNPTTLQTLPTIPSTTNSISTPSALSNNTWGFAVEGTNNFDSTYTANNASNNYSNLPTTNTVIYNTTEWPIPQSDHTFYYATRLDTNTVAGTYSTTITYTAIGEAPTPAPKTCKNQNNECIMFTVDTTADGTYSIPTSGYVSGTSNHTYDWDVYVDGYSTDACTNGNCTGSGGIVLPGAVGIELTGLSNNTHQILIVPHDDPIPGWGNAFGYSIANNVGTANIAANKNKLISLDAPLTTMAFAPKVEESTTDASFMFAYLFYNCRNLKTATKILNTYALPNTVTNLSNFFYATYYSNALSTPVDLTAMSDFLNFNTSISNLSHFFSFTHHSNAQLTSPIDLTPLKNWFPESRKMTTLTAFMFNTHNGNTSLDLTGQTILPNWIKTMTNNSDVPLYDTGTSSADYSFYRTFYASKSGDTDEVKFEDGTVLSSLGEPSTNRQTYTNRSGIIPVNNNWK